MDPFTGPLIPPSTSKRILFRLGLSVGPRPERRQVRVPNRHLTGVESPAILPKNSRILTASGAESGAVADINSPAALSLLMKLTDGLTDEERAVLARLLCGSRD
jgi:hypothetical protein